jgi:serine/threonine protein kinase
LTREGKAKVADLGLAMIRNQSDRVFAPGDSRSGDTALATLGYMSPEQAANSSRVDHRSDVYSLGVTFYHTLTGQLPFLGRTRDDLIFKHATVDPGPPHELVPGLSPAISNVIVKMLAKEPGNRHQTYAELQRDLTKLIQLSPANPVSPGNKDTGSFDPHDTTLRTLTTTTSARRAVPPRRENASQTGVPSGMFPADQRDD